LLGSTFSLGRIAGIPFGAHWSALVVLGFVAITLATSVFADASSPQTAALLALVAALALFASVVLHELGHALQARREGIRTNEISLWLLGGVAALEDAPRTAGGAFRIAAAGPAVTAVLAALLVPAALLVDGPGGAVIGWVAYANVLLLAFNLIPAFPLDGGRILQAALWRRSGDRVRATVSAARAGRAFGFGLIGLGAGLFVVGSGIGGVWLAVLGWFLSSAATAERDATRADDSLAGVTVADVMTSGPVTVDGADTLGEVVDDVVWRHRVTAYPVLESDALVGLLPFRRVAQTPRERWDWVRVRERMLPLDEVLVVASHDPAFEVAAQLSRDATGRALVVDAGELVGIVSVTDIARALELGAPLARVETEEREPIPA
jgi:Zn-dependent protease/predicted transcriptional regulator